MAKFQLRPIDAVQLTWENWNEVCDLLKVGKFSEGKPEGCYLDPATMLPFDDPQKTSEILGLKIPSNFDRKKYELVKQGDWLVNIQDTFRPMSDELFRKLYEPAIEWGLDYGHGESVTIESVFKIADLLPQSKQDFEKMLKDRGLYD